MRGEGGRLRLGWREGRDVPAAAAGSPADDDVTSVRSEFWEPGDGVC